MKLYQEFKTGKSPMFLVWIILIFGVILIFFPIIFTTWRLIPLEFGNNGELGDMISGTTMPFISFAGIILTFYAFWIQYKANIELRRDIEVERFENKYYELLKLHKENINEINIDGKIKGRDVFVSLYDELRFIFHFTKNFILRSDEKELFFKKSDEEKILEIAYVIFFIGVQVDANKYIENLLEKLLSKNKIKELFESVYFEKGKYESAKNANMACSYYVNGIKFLFEYLIFQGHISRLGHYYRHLFQLVEFIDSRKNILITDKERNIYTRTIRGQLSAYEQLMFYYNSLSKFGNAWIRPEHPYLTKYRFIKNMPLHLADFGVDPVVRFKTEIEEFKKNGIKFFELE